MSPPAIPKRVDLCRWKAVWCLHTGGPPENAPLGPGGSRGGGRGPYRPRPARQGPYPERKATRYSTKLHRNEVHPPSEHPRPRPTTRRPE
eukprot:scaffold18671_cov54-Phaeocystis_antarctica.AAC.1